MKKLIGLSLYVFIYATCWGADLPVELETYLLRYSDREIGSDLIKGLEALYHHPSNLWEMKEEEVALLFFLTEDQQYFILTRRPVSTKVLEDQSIVREKDKLELLNLLTRSQPDRKDPKVTKGRTQASGRWKTRLPAIPDSSFQGENYSLSFEYSVSYGAWSAFGTCEKDLQEANWLDFFNGGIKYKPNSHHTLILGSYQVNWQQGVALRQGFSFDYLIDDPLFLRKSASPLNFYSGTSVNQGFRGLAWQTGYRLIHLDLIISRRYYDANLDDSGQVSSLDETGYHRNSREKSNTNTLLEDLAGSMMAWRGSKLWLSGAFYMSRYDPGFSDAGPQRQEIRLKGTQNQVGALSFSWVPRTEWGMFSEWGMVKNGSCGVVAGGWMKRNEYKSSIMFRYYGVDFYNLHSGAFSYRDRNQNEKGLIWAVSRRWETRRALSGVLDIYQSLDRTYTSIFPLRATIIQLRYQQGLLEGLTQFRQGSTYRQSDLAEITAKDGYIRMTAEWERKRSDRWLVRIEYKWAKEEALTPAEGWLCSIRNSQIVGWGEITSQGVWFSTDGYDARIYLYCRELPGLWSVPAFYGRGCHAYIMSVIKKKNWKIALKGALTYYPNTRVYSDGREGHWFQEYGLYGERRLEF